MNPLKQPCRYNIHLHPDIARIGLEAIPGVVVSPGQFFMLAPPSGPRSFFLRRPFSIHDAYATIWEFLVQITGCGSRQIGRIQPGEPINLTGPFGKPFPMPPSTGDVLLISGGIGMATLFPFHKVLVQKGFRVHHVYGARTQDRLVRIDDLADFGGTLSLATDDGSFGFHGRLDAVIAGHPEWLESCSTAYICGPVPMMNACRRALRSYWKGFIYASLETVMGCGFGVCRGCAVPLHRFGGYAMACSDGPVFNADDVDWSCLPSP